MIRFFDKAMQDGTGRDGLPTYSMVPYFEAYRSASIHVIRPARGTDKVSHPKEWKAYLAAREPDHDGFPLAAWPQINDAERQGLAERGIHTLETLIDTDMTGAPKEFQEAQEHAKEFMANMRSDAPKLAARIDELETENGALKDQIEDLKKAVAAAEAKAKKAA